MGNNTDQQAPRALALPMMSAALTAAFAEIDHPWRVAPELTPDALDAMTRDGDLTPLQAQLLSNRGIHDAATARTFLAGEWRGRGATLPNLAEAVVRLRRAARDGKRIVVFGDYDSDGMTSCAILLLALRALGAQATPYIPRRDDDGRGLNREAVDLLASQGAQLLVTTDCGSANVAEVARAHELGIEVIVTDHHPPYGELPDCLIVNPQLGHVASAPTDGAPPRNELADLAGAGVAFHLAEALLTMPQADLAEPGESARTASDSPTLTETEANETLESLLDLAAIGAIGDVVPLTAHNWALAHAGLARLRAQPRLGLRALLASANIAQGQVTERDIAFAIAPRLNAAARLGEPMTALNLLICEDDAQARQLAARLESLNLERQRLTDEIMTQAREQARQQLRWRSATVNTPGGSAVNGAGGDVSAQALYTTPPPLVVVMGDHWPLGIIGLVSGRLVDEFGCAAVTLSRDGDECRGSARGPVGANLVEALAERPEFFRRFGGHARAAGFTIAAADVPALVAYLTARLTALGTSNAWANAGPEPLAVDCRLPLNRVTLNKNADIRRLAPFGAAFPEPQFLCQGARIMRCWRSGVEGRNLRVALRDSKAERIFLWSRQGALSEELRAALSHLPTCDFVYTFDAYQRPDGEQQVTARVLALRLTPTTDDQ